VSRLLIEASLPEGPKFIDASELAFSLHIKAMCYCARALTNGFVPASKPFTLVKASPSQVKVAIEHLTVVQPGADNPSWEERPGGWFIHDYDDPQYMNPMRAEVAELASKRRLAGKKGGLQSVKKRLERFGTAQPIRAADANSPAEANPEANPEAPASVVASTEEGAAPKQTPKHPSRSALKLPSPPSPSATPGMHAVEEMSSEEHGDNAMLGGNGVALPSLKVQAGRLLDWFMAKRGWSTWESPDVQKREAQRAIAIVELELPREQLYAELEAMWQATDPDDRPSSLGYFWTQLQEEQHAALKQSRSHARTDEGLTKLAPSSSRRGKA